MAILPIDELKKKIDDNIYQNSQQAITGVRMNTILNDMVDSLDETETLDTLSKGLESVGQAVQTNAENISANAKAITANKEEADAKLTELEQSINNYKPIVINGNVTNAPDEEDITSNDENLLQFKNRSSLNGMGYIILRQNKPFAEQLTQTDTIYEIRYNFDLNSADVTIPSNCILNFVGGSLSNGTLILSTNVDIKASDVKIFNSIYFRGECNNIYFHIDWFVGNFANSISELEPDATNEIQHMLDCGIKKVFLTNKRHYRISRTLVVSPDITIEGIPQQKYPLNDVNKYIFASGLDAPMIKVKAYAGSHSSTMKNIYLYRLTSIGECNADNNYKKDISTVYYDCTEGSLWGINFDGVITGRKSTCTFYAEDGVTTKDYGCVGYTAIEVYAGGQNPLNGYGANYASSIIIKGYVHDYYRMVNIHKADDNSWITQVHLNFEGEATYGGFVCCTSILSGAYQSRHNIGTNNDGFYDIAGTCVFSGGYIWDTSATSSMTPTGFYSTKYSVKADDFTGGEYQYGLYANNERLIKEPLYSFDLGGRAKMHGNMLAPAFYNTMRYGVYAGPVHSVVYKVFENQADYDTYKGIDSEQDTTKGISITKENTTNYEYLFEPNKVYYNNIGGFPAPQYYNTAKSSYVTDQDVKIIMLTCKAVWLQRASVIVFGYNANSTAATIKITTNAGTRIYRSSPYFNPLQCPLLGNSSEEEIEVVIIYDNIVRNVDIPFIGVCGPEIGNSYVGIWGGSTIGEVRHQNLALFNYTENSVYKSTKLLSAPEFINFTDITTNETRTLIHITFSGIVRMAVVKYKDTYGEHSIFINHLNDVAYISGSEYRGQLSVYINDDGRSIYITKSYLTHTTIEYVHSNVDIKEVNKDTIADLSAFTLCTLKSQTVGATADRPTIVNDGYEYYDTDLDMPIYWDTRTQRWLGADGFTAGYHKGDDESRPTLTMYDQGFTYWDVFLNKLIVWNGNAWVDSNGAVV